MNKTSAGGKPARKRPAAAAALGAASDAAGEEPRQSEHPDLEPVGTTPVGGKPARKLPAAAAALGEAMDVAREEPRQSEHPSAVSEPVGTTPAGGKPARKRPAASAALGAPDATGPTACNDDCATEAGEPAPHVKRSVAKQPTTLKSSERHRLYSKVYHSKRVELQKLGKDDDEAKAIASQFARDAVSEKFKG